MSTADITAAIQVRAAELGCRLFRNNSGLAVYAPDKPGKQPRHVRFGVGPNGGGGADLLGWDAVGRFLSIEVKNADRPTAAQRKWAKWVIAGGGKAGFARSVGDAERIMTGD